MPKRYTVEMTITNAETATKVDTDTDVEFYDDDQEAARKFNEKKQAARKAGKGRPEQE
jgi:hypothetical protein